MSSGGLPNPPNKLDVLLWPKWGRIEVVYVPKNGIFEIYSTFDHEQKLYNQGKIVVFNLEIGVIYSTTLVTGTSHAEHNVFLEECLNWDEIADQFESRCKEYKCFCAKQQAQ